MNFQRIYIHLMSFQRNESNIEYQIKSEDNFQEEQLKLEWVTYKV